MIIKKMWQAQSAASQLKMSQHLQSCHTGSYSKETSSTWSISPVTVSWCRARNLQHTIVNNGVLTTSLRFSALLKSITYFSIFTVIHQDKLAIWKAHFASHYKTPVLCRHCGVCYPLPVFPSWEILFRNCLNHCQVFVLLQSAVSK